jgi:hypothetical protein
VEVSPSTTTRDVIRDTIVDILAGYEAADIAQPRVTRAIDDLVKFITDCMKNVKELQAESDDAHWKRALVMACNIKSKEAVIDRAQRIVTYYRSPNPMNDPL